MNGKNAKETSENDKTSDDVFLPTFQQMVLGFALTINDERFLDVLKKIDVFIRELIKNDYGLDIAFNLCEAIHGCYIAEKIYPPNFEKDGKHYNTLTGENLVTAAGSDAVWNTLSVDMHSKFFKAAKDSGLYDLMLQVDEDVLLKIMHSLFKSISKPNVIQALLFPKRLLKNFDDVFEAMKSMVSIFFQHLKESIDLHVKNTENGRKNTRSEELEEVQELLKIWNQPNSNPYFNMVTQKISASINIGLKEFYHSLFEEKNQQVFDQLKNECKTEGDNNEFHSKLLKIQQETRSAKLYGQIIEEGVPIDQTGAAAIALMLTDILHQSITVSIKNENDETFYHHVDHPNKDIRILRLDLQNQHYGQIENAISDNSCLFNEIVNQVPVTKEYYSNDSEFRKALSNFISTDEYFVKHIRNRWHSYTIRNRAYGGRLLKDPVDFEHLLKTDMKKQIETIQICIQKTANKTIQTMKQIDSSCEQFENVISVFNQMPLSRHCDKRDLDSRKKSAKNMIDKFEGLADDLSPEMFKSWFDKPVKNMKENVKKWINLQEQLPSEQTCQKLQELHLKNEQKFIEKSILQQLCENIAVHLQKFQEIFPYNVNNNVITREPHTVAVGIIQSQPTTLFLAFNYFNREAKSGLTQGEKYIIIEEIMNVYGEKLRQQNLSKIQILKRCDTAEKTEALTQLKSILIDDENVSEAQEKCERVLKNFEHDAHAEMFFPAVENALAKAYHLSPEYHKIIVGVGKGSCIKCQAYFDNVGISNHIAVGDIQAQVPRHIHPNDIKFEYDVEVFIGEKFYQTWKIKVEEERRRKAELEEINTRFQEWLKMRMKEKTPNFSAAAVAFSEELLQIE